MRNDPGKTTAESTSAYLSGRSSSLPGVVAQLFDALDSKSSWSVWPGL